MAEIVGGGPRRRWIPVAAVLFLIAAGLAAVVVLRGDSSTGHPDRVALEFLQARSCRELRQLADSQLRARLGQTTCQILIDAADGRRTYADPRRDRHLTRELRVGHTDAESSTAQVPVTVSYSGESPPPGPERMVVVLRQREGRWLVDDWGIPR